MGHDLVHAFAPGPLDADVYQDMEAASTQGLALLTGLSFASGGNTLGRAASRMIQPTINNRARTAVTGGCHGS